MVNECLPLRREQHCNSLGLDGFHDAVTGLADGICRFKPLIAKFAMHAKLLNTCRINLAQAFCFPN
jgi:hypothetical protein